LKTKQSCQEAWRVFTNLESFRTTLHTINQSSISPPLSYTVNHIVPSLPPHNLKPVPTDYRLAVARSLSPLPPLLLLLAPTLRLPSPPPFLRFSGYASRAAVLFIAMNNLLEPSPKPTELSSQAGQAKPVTNESEMEIWNKDELLNWIKKKKPGLLEGENLEKFNAAYISGQAFLDHAGDLGFFKECNLPMGTSSDLADLANETKKSKHCLSYHGCSSDSQLIVSQGVSEQASLQELSGTTPKKRRLDTRKEASRSPSSKLVVSGELGQFPLSRSNFSEIRRQPGVAYFDKTEYIAELENGTDVQLLCRPRRFGKSLTVTMLRCFHGFQFRNQYDQLFKVCGTLFGQDLHAHITYAKLGSRRG
jgi:Predicted AAA-ATPase